MVIGHRITQLLTDIADDGVLRSDSYHLSAAFVIALLLWASPAFCGAPPVKSLLEMRQDNVAIQKWDLSCGAGALATILNYGYNDPVTEKEIATALIKRQEYLEFPELVQVQQGFSLLDLKRYVEQRGYEAIGYGKMTLEDLIERAPIMVPISANGYNHFVVFRGVWGNRVLLADPAWGNRTMTLEKFQSLWLDFPNFGRVGFVVNGPHGMPDNRLAPRSRDFLTLR